MNRRNRQILLVEDNNDDIELALRALRTAGVTCPVDVCSDGEEALEYFSARVDSPPSSLPFLILMDIQLPKLDGLQVLQRLRSDARTRLVPIVILSSSDIEEDIQSAYHLGANSYVRKPIEFSSYSETVQQIGRYWGHINESAESPRI